MNVIFLDIDGVLNSELYYRTEEYKFLQAQANALLKQCGETLKAHGHSDHRTCGRKLCPRCTWEARSWEGHDIDRRAVSFLNGLVRKTGAEVVVSSTWRGSHTRPELERLLRDRGYEHSILGYTPHLNQDCLRGNEILKWVKDNEKLIGKSYHEFRSYVILDDDSDMLYWQRDNFVLVDGYVGLTPRNCWRAERMMTGTNVIEYPNPDAVEN